MVEVAGRGRGVNGEEVEVQVEGEELTVCSSNQTTIVESRFIVYFFTANQNSSFSLRNLESMFFGVCFGVGLKNYG